MVHGRLALLSLELLEPSGAESGVMHGCHKGSQDAVPLGSSEVIKKFIVFDTNGVKVLKPLLPAPYMLGTGCFGDCMASG